MNIQEKRLENTPIYYWICGKKDAESILFIHAAFADHTSFDEQVNYFSSNYHVITLDLIGHGKSLDTQKGDGIDKTADYIYKILIAEGIDKIHLAGVSLGAVLVQDFANKFPERVASLCCIGGYDINHFDPAMQKENSSQQIKMMLKALISIKWFSESNKKISAISLAAQENFYQMNIRFKKSSFRYLAGLSNLVNQSQAKPRIYPLFVGCGAQDIPMAIEVCKQWHTYEPESKLVIFENAGHLVNMDTPEAFNKILEKHLIEK